jgi:hypothetical protein
VGGEVPRIASKTRRGVVVVMHHVRVVGSGVRSWGVGGEVPCAVSKTRQGGYDPPPFAANRVSIKKERQKSAGTPSCPLSLATRCRCHRCAPCACSLVEGWWNRDLPFRVSMQWRGGGCRKPPPFVVGVVSCSTIAVCQLPSSSAAAAAVDAVAVCRRRQLQLQLLLPSPFVVAVSCSC